MKKLLFIIVFGWSALFGAYNECVTDIYFGNGVWNDYDGANKGRNKLEKMLLRYIYITKITTNSNPIISQTEAIPISIKTLFCLPLTGRVVLLMNPFRSNQKLLT